MSGRPVTIALVALVAVAIPLRAQTATVRGRVLNAETGAPLADAEVTLHAAGYADRTDPAGVFELQEVPPGADELQVRRVGFVPTRQSLVLAAGETRHLEVWLRPSALLLDSLVVAAPYDTRRLGGVPGTMTVVDSTSIQVGRTAGLQEPLRLVPGIQATPRGGTDDVNLSIRGSGARVQIGVHGVEVLLDGVPLTEADGAARLDLVELANTRELEVVRGPSSALYAGAAGAVNVVTRRPAEQPGVTVRAQRGQWGFEKYDGSAGVRLAGAGGARVSGAYTRADGYRVHDDARTVKGSAMLDTRMAPGTQLIAELSGASIDARWPGAVTQVQYEAAPRAASAAAVAFGVGRTDHRYRVGLRAAQDVGTGLATAYTYYGGRRFELAVPGVALHANFHRIQFGGRVRSALRQGSPVEIAIGVDYDRFFGDDRRLTNTPPEHPALFGHSDLSVPTTGLYAQAAWRVAPEVDVVAGVRYDRVTYRSDDVLGDTPTQRRTDAQLSPKLTARWRVGGRGSLYVTAAHGFEVLAFGEVQDGPGLPFNTVQKPKRLWNYEIGGRTVVRDGLVLEAALFYQPIRNELVANSSDGLPVFSSASRSRSIGLELGVTAAIRPWLDLAGAYTFSDFRFRAFRSFVTGETGQPEEHDYAGNQLPGNPRHRVAIELRARPLAGVSGAVQLDWQGRVFVDNANQIEGAVYALGPGGLVTVPARAVPARALVHLHGAWQLGAASIFGSVENLFDTRYVGIIDINDTNGRFYEAGAPRWVTLGASITLTGLGR